jgi:hypothetical protein
MRAERAGNPLAREFCKLRDRSAITRILRRALYLLPKAALARL